MSTFKTIFFFATALLLGCSDNAESTEPAGEKYFISADEVGSYSAATLQAFAVAAGQGDIAPQLKYDVKSYRVVYQTMYNGAPIQASGLLLVPVGMKEPAPIVSVQHGTMFKKDEAPTVSNEFSGIEFFTSAGFISLMPDFIGYGESEAIFHPYYDRQHSAMAVVDMIRAGKDFLKNKKIAFNNQLFLTGYSEGGYVTLAAAKEIETNSTYGLTVTAVGAGAGGYDLVEMLSGVATNTYYAYPSYLAFVLMSYNTTYSWNKPLTYFFKPTYATALGKYMNGQYGGGFINSKLTTNTNELFDEGFYTRLKQLDGELELKTAIQNNSVGGWNTAIPTRLFHGTKDEIIPYENSEVTLANFKEAGSKDITLTLIPNGTHGTSFIPMMRDCIPWFLSLKK